MLPHSGRNIAFSVFLVVDQHDAALDAHRPAVQPCAGRDVDGDLARNGRKSPSLIQISFHLGSVRSTKSPDGTSHNEISDPLFPSVPLSLPSSTVRSACNNITAPFFSRSSLPLPQRGDWTQAGQPERHWQRLR